MSEFLTKLRQHVSRLVPTATIEPTVIPPREFPEHTGNVGLPQESTIIGEMALRTINNANREAGISHGLNVDAQTCWLGTDLLNNIVKKELGLPAGCSALAANEKLEEQGGVKIQLPITQYEAPDKPLAKAEIRIYPTKAYITVTDLNPITDTSSRQELVASLPRLGTRFVQAISSVSSIVGQAASDFSEGDGYYKPLSVRNKGETEFLSWAKYRFSQPTYLAIEKMVKEEKDSTKLAVLKGLLSVLEDSNYERKTLKAILENPSSAITVRNNLLWLNKIFPSSLPQLLLISTHISEVAKIAQGSLSEFIYETLAGRKYSIPRKSKTGEDTEMLVSLPKEFSERVKRTDEGIEIGIADMGEAKMLVILGAIEKTLKVASDCLMLGSFKPIYLSPETWYINSLNEPGCNRINDVLTIDSGYLYRTRVGEREFNRAMYPDYLLSELDSIQNRQAGVITLVGRSGAGKSELAKHIGKRLAESTNSTTMSYESFGPPDNLVILRFTGQKTSEDLLEALKLAKEITEKRATSKGEGARKGTILVVEEAHLIKWDPELRGSFLDTGERIQAMASGPDPARRPIMGFFIIGELVEGEERLPAAEKSFLSGDESVLTRHRLNKRLVVLNEDEMEIALLTTLKRAIKKQVKNQQGDIVASLNTELEKKIIEKTEYDRRLARLNSLAKELASFLETFVEGLLLESDSFVRLTGQLKENKTAAASYFNATRIDAVGRLTQTLFKADISAYLNQSAGATILKELESEELQYNQERMQEIQRKFRSTLEAEIEAALTMAKSKMALASSEAAPPKDEMAKLFKSVESLQQIVESLQQIVEQQGREIAELREKK